MKRHSLLIAAGFVASLAAPVPSFGDGLSPLPPPAKKPRPTGSIGPPPQKLFRLRESADDERKRKGKMRGQRYW